MATTVRAVVFDVDGVLVEIKFPIALPTMLGITREDAMEFYDGPFLKCLVGEADLSCVLPAYLDRWNWAGTFQEFVARWFEIESSINRPVLSLVDRLRSKGIRCYLASTQEQMRASHLKALLGVGERFEKAFFSCFLGCKKPDQRFFDAVTQDIGLLPEAILLVDDHQANVESAKAMGWNAVRYRIGADDLHALTSAIGADV
jgi:putative hydrolase of the HAD superfamily